MAEGYSNKTNSSTTTERQLNHQRFGNHSNQPSNSSYMMRRGSRNRTNSNGDNNRQQRQVCRFFRRGACLFGERCRFAHTESSSANNEHETASTSSITPSVSPTKRDVSSTSTSPSSIYEKWLDAPEFVPSASKAKIKSYAEVVNPPAIEDEVEKPESKLCPYAEMHGVCSYPEGECMYIHGDICDLCGNAALHPDDSDKRKEHTQSCIKQHERNMELSFAVARSKDKSCGVCFEVVMEKASREQRFGILPNCNHVFCLSCIRKWRQAKQFDNKIIRACPECRVTSDFVCPSMFWVDTKEEKEKLIKDYKVALSQKHCKYFKQGRGKCPFGNKCFYLHALPDGTKTDVGPPPRQPRRQNHDGDIDMLQPGYSTEAGRESMIWSVLRRFDQYNSPPTQIQYRYGSGFIRIQRRQLHQDEVLIEDVNDNTFENHSTNSEVDFDNGFVFSFVRSTNVLSVIPERRASYGFASDDYVPTREEYYQYFYVDSDIITEAPSESDSDDEFGDNYDSDGMGERISRLSEPIDDQFDFDPAQRSAMRALYYADNETRQDTIAQESLSELDVGNATRKPQTTYFRDDDSFWNKQTLERFQFMINNVWNSNYTETEAPTMLNKTNDNDFAPIRAQPDANFSNTVSEISSGSNSLLQLQATRVYDPNSLTSNWLRDNRQAEDNENNNDPSNYCETEYSDTENSGTDNRQIEYSEDGNWQIANWQPGNWQARNWQAGDWQTAIWQSDNGQIQYSEPEGSETDNRQTEYSEDNWQIDNKQTESTEYGNWPTDNRQTDNWYSENWQSANWRIENWCNENGQSDISHIQQLFGDEWYEESYSTTRTASDYNIKEITNRCARHRRIMYNDESDSDDDTDEDLSLHRRRNYHSGMSVGNGSASVPSNQGEPSYIVTLPDDVETDSEDDFCLAQLFQEENATDGPTIEEIIEDANDMEEEIDDFFKDEEELRARPIVRSPNDGFSFSSVHQRRRNRFRYIVRVIPIEKAHRH